MTVVALFVGVAVALVFNYILDKTRLERSRRDLRACLFEIWLYRHDPAIVMKSQWALMRANGRYIRVLFPTLLVAMLIISPVLVQSYHRFGLEPLASGTEALLSVELERQASSGDFARTVPELVWANGRGSVTAMVRKPSVNQVVWRLKPSEAGIHTLHLVGGARIEAFPLYVGSRHDDSVTQARQATTWRSLLQPRGAELAADSGLRRVWVDYPEADSAWLIWLTAVSLLAALVTNRFASRWRQRRVRGEDDQSQVRHPRRRTTFWRR